METNESFVALVIYPSTPPAQAGLADTLLRMTEATLRSMPHDHRRRLVLGGCWL